MSEPRAVVFTTADYRSMTGLEQARAIATAGVKLGDLERLVGLTADIADADPADVLRATELMYALAWQYRRRSEPECTWAAAQTWDLKWTDQVDEVAEAEAELSVRTAVATGLPPSIAGNLTHREREAYGRIQADQARELEKAMR